MQYNQKFLLPSYTCRIFTSINDTADRHSPAVDSTSAVRPAADSQDKELGAQGSSLEPRAVDLEAAGDRPRAEREEEEDTETAAYCTTDTKAVKAGRACSGTESLKHTRCCSAGEVR